MLSKLQRAKNAPAGDIVKKKFETMHDLSLHIQQSNAITECIDNCIVLLLVPRLAKITDPRQHGDCILQIYPHYFL